MREGAASRKTRYLLYLLLATCVVSMATAYPHPQEPADDDSDDDDDDKVEKTWEIKVIADLDSSSAVETEKGKKWQSYLKNATVSRDENGNYGVSFEVSKTLMTQLTVKGKGMELSELCEFNDKLYTVDDKTGVVYEIPDVGDPIPFVILNTGNGKNRSRSKESG